MLVCLCLKGRCQSVPGWHKSKCAMTLNTSGAVGKLLLPAVLSHQRDSEHGNQQPMLMLWYQLAVSILQWLCAACDCGSFTLLTE